MSFSFSADSTAVSLDITSRADLSVLVIDDEPHVRTYLRTVLRRLDVTIVREASSGEDGLHLYEQHRPSVVLLDVNMPGLTGLEVIRELMRRDPDAAVIVMSSVNASSVMKQFAALGAMSYVLKHGPPRQVEQMLGYALDCLVGD